MPPTNPLQFFIHVSRPYVGWVFAATVVVIIGSIIGQSLPLFYKWIIEAIEVGDVQYALWLGLLYPAAVFVESLFWRLSGVFGMKWSTWVKVETNTVLTVYTMQHGKNYFSNHFAGALLNKASNVIGGMETFVHDFYGLC